MERDLKRNKEETVMEQAISGYGKAGFKILYTNELRMLLLENPSVVKFYLILRKLILRLLKSQSFLVSFFELVEKEK